MSIRIITDSASDVEQKELANVTVLPMTVTIDEVPFKDGIDINKNDFYEKLEHSDTIPVTSLINPVQFEEAFEEVKNAGDEAIVITISSKLSGTYQSAMIAAEEFDNISVVDSMQVAGAEYILVERCQELVAQGLSREEIVAALEEEKNHIVIYASVDTLVYLQKGGRISKGSAIVGGVIGIKPILTLSDGELISIGKARGSKLSNQFLDKKVNEAGGINFDKPFVVGYSGTDNSNLLSYIDNNQNLLGEHLGDVKMVQIGSAVGTHAGPGAILVAFFSNN